MIADVLSGSARWHVEHGDSLVVLKTIPVADLDRQGGASRFFNTFQADEEDVATGAFIYQAKASVVDRGEGNKHPTVKSRALMRHLCKLITPPGGVVLDAFTGSGSTGVGAVAEGFRFVGIEREDTEREPYVTIARRRIADAARAAMSQGELAL